MIVVDTVHIRHTRVWAVPNSLFRQSKAFSWISWQAVLCQLKFWHLIICKSNIFSSHSSLKHLTWILGNALLQRVWGVLGVARTPNILLTNTSHDTSHSGSGGCWGLMLPVCEVYVRCYVTCLEWSFPLFKGVSGDWCEVFRSFGWSLADCCPKLQSSDSKIGGAFVSIYT